jgi:hypothetical protein
MATMENVETVGSWARQRTGKRMNARRSFFMPSNLSQRREESGDLLKLFPDTTDPSQAKL